MLNYGADTVCIVIGGGHKGNGFSVLVDAQDGPELARVLREIADQIVGGELVEAEEPIEPTTEPRVYEATN